VYISGSIAPPAEIKGKQVPKPRQQETVKERLKESLPTVHHRWAAFKDVYGTDGLPDYLVGDVPAPKVSHSVPKHATSVSPRIGPQTEAQFLMQESLMLLQFDVDNEVKPSSAQSDVGTPSHLTAEESEGKETSDEDDAELDLMESMNDLMESEDQQDGKAAIDKLIDAKIKQETKQEDAKMRKAQDEFAKDQAQVRKTTAKRFRSLPETEKYRVNGSKLVGLWDMLTKLPNDTSVPTVTSEAPRWSLQRPALNSTQNSTNKGNSSQPELGAAASEGKAALSWGARKGIAKNFALAARVKTTKAASLKDVRRMDVIISKNKHFVLVLHGNTLSKIAVDAGNAVTVVAGAAASGKANGAGAAARFNNPKDVTAFEDPKKKGSWFAVVADCDNDNLRLVTGALSASSTVKTVLKDKMILKPRRVASLVANPSDSRSAGVRKVYVFVVAGRRTIMRIENVLGRKRTGKGKTAYQNTKVATMNKKDKEIWNNLQQPSVHIISEDFEYISAIATVSYVRDGGTRWMLFVSDKNMGGIFRMEQVLHGERRARMVPVAKVKQPSDLIVVGVDSSWFALVSQHNNNTLHRVDKIVEGKDMGRVSSLIQTSGTKKVEGIAPIIGADLLRNQHVAGLASGQTWNGKLFASLTGKSSDVLMLDLSIPLTCKDQTLMASEEFQELGELQDLGETKTNQGKMYLYNFVAMTVHTKGQPWRVVNYSPDGTSICGISTVGQSAAEGIVPYFCHRGACWPT